ncbi:MAG: hypothetical protein DRR11_09130 [Gammaproteobacteria bacterium]|nr:MAG: hypothetical protein DRR11_09130 [Gammaproteobacteria bacterium]RLA35468.1 MAG: hypothetical protein DRR15_07510 [Gammaproteobacteria bacterium]
MVRAMKTKAIIAGLLFAMVGCQTLATDGDVAARITNPTDDSRKALQSAVNAALDTNVTLANDALTDSSVLTIERNPPRSMENLPAQGRNMDMPMQFRLVLNDGNCVLIYTADDSRRNLADTSCVAE